MKDNNYIPEIYWDHVAAELEQRSSNKLLAGDNDPFYLYKRKKFLELFSTIPFKGKKIIEIGSGPGGNLLEIYKQEPLELTGTDISSRMLALCKQNIGPRHIELVKINGKDLPFPTDSFDIAITSTVLQHTTDEIMLSELIKSICRVSHSDIYIFERVGKKHSKGISNTGRTADEYTQLFGQHKMSLIATKHLHIYWSKTFCGIIRKIFNSSTRGEGEPQTGAAIFLQKLVLIITKPLDRLFVVKNDLAMLHFKKMN